jgi:hypothetical protein
MPQYELVLYCDHEAVATYDIEPEWNEIDIALFTTGIGERIYELLREDQDGEPIEEEED